MLWRESAPVIVKKGYSMVVDQGELKSAVPDSHGNYLFSEVGAGVKPLVLVGEMYKITEFLYKNRDKKIHNKIPDLPNVYLSADRYVPGERFKGIIGVGDIVTTLTRQMLDFVPGTAISDFLGNAITFGSTLKDLIHKSAQLKSKYVYVKLSYLNDDSAINLGRKYVDFGKILRALYGVKDPSIHQKTAEA